MPDIVHMVRIAAGAAKIAPLFSSGSGFTQWWAEDVERDSNGVVRLGFFNRTTIYVLRADGAPTSIHAAWRCESGDEWSGTRLVFDLAPAGNDQTILRFAHAGWRNPTDYFISCNTTWGELMYRLKAAAEGKSLGPLFVRNGLAY